jgi:hypothetical protein
VTWIDFAFAQKTTCGGLLCAQLWNCWFRSVLRISLGTWWILTLISGVRDSVRNVISPSKMCDFFSLLCMWCDSPGDRAAIFAYFSLLLYETRQPAIFRSLLKVTCQYCWPQALLFVCVLLFLFIITLRLKTHTLNFFNFNTCTVHLLLFCTMTNKCTQLFHKLSHSSFNLVLRSVFNQMTVFVFSNFSSGVFVVVAEFCLLGLYCFIIFVQWPTNAHNYFTNYHNNFSINFAFVSHCTKNTLSMCATYSYQQQCEIIFSSTTLQTRPFVAFSWQHWTLLYCSQLYICQQQ